MKQRILVAVVGIPLLLLVLCWAPHWATAALLAALGIIGAHELLAAVCGPEKTKQLWVLAGVLAVLTVFSTYAGMDAYKKTVLAAAPWLLCAGGRCCFSWRCGGMAGRMPLHFRTSARCCWAVWPSLWP